MIDEEILEAARELLLDVRDLQDNMLNEIVRERYPGAVNGLSYVQYTAWWRAQTPAFQAELTTAAEKAACEALAKAFGELAKG